MAGRRLVDAAKLFNASKSIAGKHVTLRSAQLDAFSKTSTLAKAAKKQTDRVTLTAQAAIALSQRLNEDAPSYASAAASDASARWNRDIPRNENLRAEQPSEDIKDGLEQDHHYDRSGSNSVADPPAKGELDLHQQKAQRRPLPDGTIPSPGSVLEEGNQGREPIPARHAELSSDEARRLQRQAEAQIPSRSDEKIQPPQSNPRAEELIEGHDRDVFYTRSKEAQPEPSSLPRTKIPKHTENKQNSDDHVDTGRINQDVYYATPEPGKNAPQHEELPHQAAVPEQDQIPEGVNTDVFRTTRVAKMLGVHPKESKPALDLKGASRTPHDRTKTALGHDQDSFNVRSSEQTKPSAPEEAAQDVPDVQKPTEKEMHDLASDIAKDAAGIASPVSEVNSEMSSEPEKVPYQLRESRVPSSRFGRLWQYAGLGTSMALGAVGESLRRVTGTAASTGGSLMLSPGNMEILVAKLSRMRGAALKLGQVISFQDMKVLPVEIQQVLQRVQDSADYMPASQRNKVLTNNLGPEWRDLFETFDDIPIAAASIGQVHKAVLRSTGQTVAVKIQYPGVSNSIDSDLNNLSILLTASRLLPKGLFLDKTIENARTELAWECDYTREAECQQRFHAYLQDDTDAFTVPKVFPEASGREVLTAEFMDGTGVTKLKSLSQEERDWIGTQILRLCLREIVEFKFMQTDPNWTNFLYNQKTRKIELLDFGASRDYPEEFTSTYVDTLIAASQDNRPLIRDLSLQLGYLTGAESPSMLETHIQSVLTLAEPFQAHGPEVYDFTNQTITDRVRSFIPVMLRERLTPPPEETYSLHRKLSGAFLLCARLGAKVRCKELFQNAIEAWRRQEGKRK